MAHLIKKEVTDEAVRSIPPKLPEMYTMPEGVRMGGRVSEKEKKGLKKKEAKYNNDMDRLYACLYPQQSTQFYTALSYVTCDD